MNKYIYRPVIEGDVVGYADEGVGGGYVVNGDLLAIPSLAVYHALNPLPVTEPSVLNSTVI